MSFEPLEMVGDTRAGLNGPVVSYNVPATSESMSYSLAAQELMHRAALAKSSEDAIAKQQAEFEAMHKKQIEEHISNQAKTMAQMSMMQQQVPLQAPQYFPPNTSMPYSAPFPTTAYGYPNFPQ